MRQHTTSQDILIRIPEMDALDKFLEAAAILLLIILWAAVISIYGKLPDQIPVHFNAAGEVDEYGDRITIFGLPAVATFVYILLTILNKYPHKFNYPVKISNANAQAQYLYAMRLMRIVKLIVILICGILTYAISASIHAGESRINAWLLPLVILLVTIPIVFYLVKAIQNR